MGFAQRFLFFRQLYYWMFLILFLNLKVPSESMYILVPWKFMSIEQRKLIMNTFISSHFSYCPLIWMCHSRSLNTQINRIHERALRIVYSDNVSSFEELLKISGSVMTHHRNIQQLAVEIYKTLNNLSSSLMTELFQTKKTKYDLRKGNTLISRNVKTVYFGTESISYLAPKIWELIPKDIKNCGTLNSFKSKIK